MKTLMSVKAIFVLLFYVLSQTPGNVVKGTGADASTGYAGATITAGMPVYIDEADNDEIKPCQATAEATAECAGIALNGGSTGQPIIYQHEGLINLGAALTVGTAYYVDDGTAGAIAVFSDLDTGNTDYVTYLGTAVSSTEMEIKLQPTGIKKE